MLSLAARRWYTDTTNGFGAYSARYLNNPRVQPFCAVFDRYNLSFYLTVRASQLGLRTGEIGVERRYSLGGSIPTKVSGVRGYIEMFGELLSVALGFAVEGCNWMRRGVLYT